MLDNETLKIYLYRQDVPIQVETSRGIAEIDYMTGRSEQWLAMQNDIDTIHIAMAFCSKLDGKAPEYSEFRKLLVKDLSKIRMAGTNLKGGLDAQIELDCLECNNSYNIMLYQVSDFFTPITTLESFLRASRRANLFLVP